MNLTKLQLNNIKVNLPNAKDLLHGEDTDYNMLFVSVFDHWLSEKECDQIYEKTSHELTERRNKFEGLIKDLYSLTDTYIWRFKRHYRVFVYKPNTLKHLLLNCDIKNQTWQTGKRYDVLLPKLEAIYSEEWDWTNIIWYRKKEKIAPLIDIVKKSGLYILEKKN